MITQDQHIDFTDLHSGEDIPPEAPMSQVSPRFRVKELLDGTILVRENMIRQLPYVIFLTVLGVIYIGNRFHAEYMVRQISELKTEVGNLRAEQITTTSELMNISRPSEVAALVKSRNLGLKESLEPPKKLRRR
jgi:hypothetical protein